MADKTVGFRIEVRGTDAQQRKLGILTGTLTRLTEQRRKDRKAVVDAGGNNKQFNAQLARTDLRLKNVRRSIARNTREIQNFGQQTKKSGGLALAITKGLNSSFRQLGSTIAIAFGARAILSTVGNAVNIFKDFEQGQANLAAVLGVSREEMAALTKQAKDLGATTAFTASEVSGLQKELAKLGFTQEEILNATGAILDLAAASGSDLPRAAEIAGSTIRAFDLDASETRRVVDVMAKSFSSSALDIEKFATAMATVAPVAKTAGLTIEETTALLGTLADRGLEASTAGTSLRNIFLELSKQGLTFEEAMAKINNATDKNVVALDLFGKRGATSAIILAENAEAAGVLEEKLIAAGGAAERMAEEQLDTLTGDTIKLTSAWEGFILSLEDGEGAIAATIRSVLQFTTALLQGASASDEAQKSTLDLFKENTKNISQANKLTKEYERLSDGTELTADESRRLGEVTEDLTDIFGTSIVEIDRETGALKLNLEEVIKQISIRQALQSEEARELIANRLKLETQLDSIESEKEFIAAIRDRKDLSFEVIEALDREAFALGATNIQSADAAASIKNLTLEEQELVKAINESNAIIFQEEQAKRDLEEINKALLESGIDLVAIAEAQTTAVKTGTGALIDAKEAAKRLKEENKRFSDEFKRALKELNDNLRALIATEDEWFERFKATSAGRIQGLLEEGEARARLRLLDADNLQESIDAKQQLEDAEFQTALDNINLRNNATEEELRAFQAKIELLTKEHEKRKTDIAKEGDAQRIKLANLFLNQSSGFLNQLGDIFEANKQRELSAAGDNAEKREEIEKKFSKKQKAVAISNALIQQALGIIRILSGVITGNPLIDAPIKALLIAQQVLATGIQIDAIASAEFEKGGKLKKGGKLVGSSHGRGGIPFTVDGVPGFEAEGGETIINKKSSRMFGGLLSRINQAGGGIGFEFGARLPASKAQFGVSLPSPLAGIITQATGRSPDILTEEFAERLGEVVADEVNAKEVTLTEGSVTDTQQDVVVIEGLSKV